MFWHFRRSSVFRSTALEVVLFACFVVSPLLLRAQTPCNDTLVHVRDTICEGMEYDFLGRIVNYTGIFFDTISRTNPDCDSIIVLHLKVLDSLDGKISVVPLCATKEGYRLIPNKDDRFEMYCRWSSNPEDPLLHGHENDPTLLVSPSVPTTYSLYFDYAATPRCPTTFSQIINPLEPVVASVYVSVSELDLDHLEFSCEDFSIGTREPRYGWAGRNWYVNGVRQPERNEFVTFIAEPWWPDTVVVMMEGYSNTCIDTAYKVIPFHHVTVLFPNVFTPDAENNNRFAPALQGLLEYELWVYDRRGVLVFHTTDVCHHWDGNSPAGVPCPQGTYTYRCRYRPTITPRGFQSLAGTVTLIR